MMNLKAALNRWMSGLVGTRKLPILVGAALILCTMAMSSCSRVLDQRVRRAQARESDLKARLASGEEKTGAESELQRAEELQRLDLLQRLEWASYDWRVRASAGEATPAEVGLVYADDATIEKVGLGEALSESGERYDLSWPRWPVYGRVLRELRAQGVRSVAFDVLLLDRRLSEDSIAVVTMGDEGRSTNEIPSDAAFANELSEGAPAVLAAYPGAVPVDLFLANASAIGDAGSPRDADSVARRVRAMTRMRWLNPEIGVFAFNNGIVCDASHTNRVVLVGAGRDGADLVLEPDAEGMVLLPMHPRTGRLSLTLGKRIPFQVEKPVWHLGIAAAGMALGLDLDHPERVPGGLRLRGTNGMERVIPVDDAGFLLVDWKLGFNRTNLAKQANLASLLEADQAREFQRASIEPDWKDRVVVVGSTASGNNLTDLGATPLTKADFLVTTHMNVADMLMRGRFVRQLGGAWEVFVVGAMALFSAAVTWKTRGVVLPLLICGLAFAWVLVCLWAFRSQLLWMPMAHPVFAGLLVPYVGMVTTRAFVEHREQQRVRGVFAKMVSPDIVEEVLRARDMGTVGAGTRRRITVFFADVRGFTELTDRVQAAAERHVGELGLVGAAAERYYEEQASEVLATVNLYLATIADVVKFHRGTLDKYIGDCVMAFWGAPVQNPRHALQGVLAALDAQWAIQGLNDSRKAETARRELENVERMRRGERPLPPLPLLNLGSGLNTGDVTVGLMGSDAHIVNYTVFGREVNLASRLEGASGHARILIGSATYEDLKRDGPELAALCRALQPIPVKGFRDAVQVYEVPWREAREAAMKHGTLLTAGTARGGV